MTDANFLYDRLCEQAIDIIDQTDRLTDETAETYVLLLDAIRTLRASLAEAYSTVERRLIETIGDRRSIEVLGVGYVEIKTARRRTGWRHDEMIPAVVAKIVDEADTLFDTDTGELLPYPVIATNVTRKLNECVSFGAGKSGLKRLGFSLDEFCNEEEAHKSVKLPARKGVAQ